MMTRDVEGSDLSSTDANSKYKISPKKLKSQEQKKVFWELHNNLSEPK